CKIRIRVVDQHVAAVLEEDDLELYRELCGIVPHRNIPPLDHKLAIRRAADGSREHVLVRVRIRLQILPPGSYESAPRAEWHRRIGGRIECRVERDQA